MGVDVINGHSRTGRLLDSVTCSSIFHNRQSARHTRTLTICIADFMGVSWQERFRSLQMVAQFQFSVSTVDKYSDICV